VFTRNVQVRRRKSFADPFHSAGQVQDAEQDQHESDGEFHGEADAGGDGESEQDDAGADCENGERVTDAPKDADPASFCDGAFAADDGRDGDDVVRVGGMTHAEEKSYGENGEAAVHRSVQVSVNPALAE